MKYIYCSLLATACFASTSHAALLLGLDARGIAQSDGTSVSSWTNGVGSAAQATAAWQPTYVTSSTFLGGKPAVRFDDDLVNADGMTTTVSGLGADYTVMALYAFRGTTVDPARMIQGGDGTRNSNNGAHNWLMGPYFGAHQMFDGGFLNSGSGATTPVIATATGNSVAVETFHLNGSLVGANIGTTTPNVIGLGAEGAWAEPADSDLGLVLVFDSTLSDDERIGVEFYMAEAYGLTGFSATQIQKDAAALQLGNFLVPEPGAMSLLLLGGIGGLLRRRR